MRTTLHSAPREYPQLIIWARHAQSRANTLKDPAEIQTLFGGLNHCSLTEWGVREAEITGQYLRDTYGNFDVYITSHYTRAIETMQVMYPGVTILQDPRLAERNGGIWSHYPKKYVQEHYPEEIVLSERMGLFNHCPLWGESWAQVEIRIRSFYHDVLRPLRDKRILICTHGRWLTIHKVFLGLLPHNQLKDMNYDSPEIQPCANTALMVMGKLLDGQLYAGKEYVAWKEENGVLVRDW